MHNHFKTSTLLNSSIGGCSESFSSDMDLDSCDTRMKDAWTFNNRKQGKESINKRIRGINGKSKRSMMCYHWVYTFLSIVVIYAIIFPTWKYLYEDMIFKHISCSQKSKKTKMGKHRSGNMLPCYIYVILTWVMLQIYPDSQHFDCLVWETTQNSISTSWTLLFKKWRFVML